jgi:hypothetical protein
MSSPEKDTKYWFIILTFNPVKSMQELIPGESPPCRRFLILTMLDLLVLLVHFYGVGMSNLVTPFGEL